MDKSTKASINIRDGIIELEGSEVFVRHYLNEFAKEINFSGRNEKEGTESRESGVKNNLSNAGATGTKKSSKRKQIIKDVKAEEFNLDAEGKTPSLKTFLSEKKPGTVAKDRIAVIAYYLAILKKAGSFTEGNVDYAYRALSLNKRPIHLRQILINLKNEKTKAIPFPIRKYGHN